jgi:hypothetical protein
MLVQDGEIQNWLPFIKTNWFPLMPLDVPLEDRMPCILMTRYRWENSNPAVDGQI